MKRPLAMRFFERDITGTVAADFKVPLFASIEKRGTEVGKVRETAALAVAATCKSRQLRDQAEV